MSLQTMDEETLKIIRRSNIKLEKYDELADRVPAQPAAAVGRPHDGSSRLDPGVVPQRPPGLHRPRRAGDDPTRRMLLPNSPMNEPEYRARARHHGDTGRARHGDGELHPGRVGRHEQPPSCVLQLRQLGRAALRLAVRAPGARAPRGRVPHRVRTDATADRTRWPIITTVLEVLEGYMAPPGSWGLFVEEIHRYLTTELILADNTALLANRTCSSRTSCARAPFPALHLAAARLRRLAERAALGERERPPLNDLELVVPRLATYPAAEMTIGIDTDICSTDVGKPMGCSECKPPQLELESPGGASTPGADHRRGRAGTSPGVLRRGRRRGS